MEFPPSPLVTSTIKTQPPSIWTHKRRKFHNWLLGLNRSNQHPKNDPSLLILLYTCVTFYKPCGGDEIYHHSFYAQPSHNKSLFRRTEPKLEYRGIAACVLRIFPTLCLWYALVPFPPSPFLRIFPTLCFGTLWYPFPHPLLSVYSRPYALVCFITNHTTSTKRPIDISIEKHQGRIKRSISIGNEYTDYVQNRIATYWAPCYRLDWIWGEGKGKGIGYGGKFFLM